MKTCPVCAGAVQDRAVTCRSCGADLLPDSQRDDDAPAVLPLAAIAAALLVVVALGIAAGLIARGRQVATVQPVQVSDGRAAREPYSVGVPWGTRAGAVSTRLMGRGLSFAEHDEDGDQVYTGAVDNERALVIAMFARGGLAKVIVVFPGPADPRASYEAAVTRLTARYGRPDRHDTTIDPHPVASWPPRPDTGGDARVWTTITDTGDVAVHYESGAWKQEADRRRAGGPQADDVAPRKERSRRGGGTE